MQWGQLYFISLFPFEGEAGLNNILTLIPYRKENTTHIHSIDQLINAV
jgi:hypothetical protein